MDLVLGLQKHFLLAVLTVADCLIDQTGSLCFRGTDFPLCDALAVDDTADKAHDQTAKSDDNC